MYATYKFQHFPSPSSTLEKNEGFFIIFNKTNLLLNKIAGKFNLINDGIEQKW